jgi:hypothetical protein
MVMLTRRRDPDAGQESWLVYYGDVHVGTIGVRSGIPHDQVPWGWRCGFYLSGIRAGRVHVRHRGHLRPGASRLRVRLAPVPVEAPRGRSRLGEISTTGRRRNIGASTAASACRMIGGLAPEAD